MSKDISRHFVTFQNRQVHYRRSGRGPPVVLLHQSPTSSRDFEPLMRRLLPRHTVFAPDMPGYGSSDALLEPLMSIEMLADQVAYFMDAVGLDSAGIYGFHTGASVATALARRHPARVRVAVAVGLMWSTAAEREKLLLHYLPDFLPRWDGSHLTWLWSRLRDQSLFFPWFARTADARMSMDGLTPEAVQSAVPDWLRCGARYRTAYEAAFRYQPELDVPHISTPHFIVDYATDPLFAHLDRIPNQPSVKIRRCATADEAHGLADELFDRFAGPGDHVQTTSVQPLDGGCWQDYLSVGGGQLRMLVAGEDAGQPILIQHGAQSSVDALRGAIVASRTDRRVFALELPGHGSSDSLIDPSELTVPAVADLLAAALRGLDLSSIDAVGVEAGAAIQVALAARGEVVVGRRSLISPIDLSQQPALCQGLLDHYADSAAVDFYGGHLLREWHTARDHLLFFPWYERRRECAGVGDPSLDAASVHRAVVDAVLAGPSGLAMRRAEVRYPLLAHLAACQRRVLIAAPRTSPRRARTSAIAETLGQSLRELEPGDVLGNLRWDL